MARIVQKYGGTSMSSVARIEKVAGRVKAWVAEGHQVVVVVSAMAGETNRLSALAQTLHPHSGSKREVDVLLSSGEQVSIALLAIALCKMGLPARSFTGWQAGIHTDAAHGKARITGVDGSAIAAALSNGEVPVIAGFQGITVGKDLSTLGRGGSDTSAVAVAAAIAADECQIYTDVDGVYTTDPRVEPRARLLPTLIFEEMLEMASLGAKVLQIRSVEFAGKHKIPLRVLSSLTEEVNTRDPGGTLILTDPDDEVEKMEEPKISGIAFNYDEAKVTIVGVPDRPGVAFSLLGDVAAAGIEVDMIVQNIAADGATTDFTFTVHRSDYQQALQISRSRAQKIGAREVRGSDDIAKLSLVGVGMRSHAGVASQMFGVLAEHDINIQLISTSEIKISVIVDEGAIDNAVRYLHDSFELDTA